VRLWPNGVKSQMARLVGRFRMGRGEGKGGDAARLHILAKAMACVSTFFSSVDQLVQISDETGLGEYCRPGG
jgi:hypothetical protein